jgi:serine/threonine protein kinase
MRSVTPQSIHQSTSRSQLWKRKTTTRHSTMASTPPWPKEVLEKYEPVRVLGKGGFATVYLAKRSRRQLKELRRSTRNKEHELVDQTCQSHDTHRDQLRTSWNVYSARARSPQHNEANWKLGTTWFSIHCDYGLVIRRGEDSPLFVADHRCSVTHFWSSCDRTTRRCCGIPSFGKCCQCNVCFILEFLSHTTL